MGTRPHVFVTVLAASTLFTSGCFFFGGGGGEKKRAAAQARARQQAALTQQQSPTRNDTVTRTLKPQASAVQWPNPEELRLSNTPPAPRPRQQAREVIEVLPDEGVLQPHAQPRSPQPVQPVDPEQPVATQQASAGAVANKGLELSDPGAEAAPGAPVEAVQAHDAPQPAQAAVTPDGLSPRIAQRLRDNPRDLTAHLDHQLERFLADEPVPDLKALSSLPAEDRELITALIDGLSNFRNGLRSENNMLLSKKVRPLLELAARLRNQAELSIPTIALCRGVTGFGNYEPVDGRFVAQRKSETIVYCEVENVSSQQAADGVWESRLMQEAVLYTEDGQRVWSPPPVTTSDRSRNRRQDFFVAQKIALPPNLSIDRYILKFTVTDQQIGRVAEATVPVQVVAAIDARPPLGPLAIPGAGTTRAPASASGTAARQASDRQTAPRADVPRATDTVDGK